MRKIVLGIIAACATSAALAQDLPPNLAEAATGLELTPAEDLAKVPVAKLPFSGEALPASVDLSASFPTPGLQAPLESCVGWASAFALKSYQEKQEEGWALSSGAGNHADRVFSPNFVYNQINGGRNRGTLFADAFRVLAQQGAAPLSAMPDTTNYIAQPSAAARDAAKRYRIARWEQIAPNNLLAIKAQLAQDNPVVIGIMVDHTFQNVGTGVWRNWTNMPVGGHAMVIVGYDDAKAAFKVINSWGTNWGDGGFGWIDYGHFVRVANEAYILFDAKNGEALPTTRPNTGPDVTPEVRAQQSSIILTYIGHNVPGPLGYGMQMQGTITLPPGVTGTGQVVIKVARPDGTPVKALTPQFSMPDGQAATSPGEFALNGGAGATLNWQAAIPYCVMDVPKGVLCTPYPSGQPQRSDLIATAQFFVNGQGVAQAPAVSFWVNL
jgi:hypothetical protein